MGEKREYRRRRRPSDEADMALRQRQVRRRQTRVPYPEEQRRMVTSEYVDPKRAAKGRRMSRRRAEQKKRQKRSILLVAALILILLGTYAAAKVWVKMDSWQNKAEKSDFVVSASEQAHRHNARQMQKPNRIIFFKRSSLFSLFIVEEGGGIVPSIPPP